MDCRRFMELLHDDFMGRLPSADSDAIRAHGEGCPSCGPLWVTANELSCAEFVQFLDDFLEDRLEPEVRGRFERHLEICSDCTAYLGSYRRTVEVTAELAQETLRDGSESPPLPPQLLRAILDAREAEPPQA